MGNSKRPSIWDVRCATDFHISIYIVERMLVVFPQYVVCVYVDTYTHTHTARRIFFRMMCVDVSMRVDGVAIG